jgi:glucokinase
MVTVGTGVGGGVVLGGQVLRGGRWRGGEIGHMVIDASGPRCNCGQPGCLEVFASGTAIARMAREARPGWQPTAPEVFAAAEHGDETAEAVLVSAARYLALGLVSLSSLLDADCYLLGGGVATQPSFLPRLRAALADPAVSGERGFDPSLVRLAALGEAAGAVGRRASCWRRLRPELGGARPGLLQAARPAALKRVVKGVPLQGQVAAGGPMLLGPAAE